MEMIQPDKSSVAGRPRCRYSVSRIGAKTAIWRDCRDSAVCDGPPVSVHRGIYPIRAYIGLVPPQLGGVKGNYFELPRVMKPSPLNLIFRPLVDGLDVPTKEGILLSFLDFDAF